MPSCQAATKLQATYRGHSFRKRDKEEKEAAAEVQRAEARRVAEETEKARAEAEARRVAEEAEKARVEAEARRVAEAEAKAIRVEGAETARIEAETRLVEDQTAERVAAIAPEAREEAGALENPQPQHQAATKLQATYRGYSSRKQTRQHLANAKLATGEPQESPREEPPLAPPMQDHAHQRNDQPSDSPEPEGDREADE